MVKSFYSYPHFLFSAYNNKGGDSKGRTWGVEILAVAYFSAFSVIVLYDG